MESHGLYGKSLPLLFNSTLIPRQCLVVSRENRDSEIKFELSYLLLICHLTPRRNKFPSFLNFLLSAWHVVGGKGSNCITLSGYFPPQELDRAKAETIHVCAGQRRYTWMLCDRFTFQQLSGISIDTSQTSSPWVYLPSVSPLGSHVLASASPVKRVASFRLTF